jgi:nanoRNase/pAp phosphatase (c-di-AMP/oligoRNAs hydrolase)
MLKSDLESVLLTESQKRQHEIFLERLGSYQNVMIATHKTPDADAIASVLLMDYILKQIHPDIKIYSFVETGKASKDTILLLNHYDYSFLDPDTKVPDTFDALLLLDIQMTDRLFLPATLPIFQPLQERKNITSELIIQMLAKSNIEIHCRDHHNISSQMNKKRYTSAIIDDAHFRSTVGLLLSEFKDLDFVIHELPEIESLSTIIYQGLNIDTRRFRNTLPPDSFAKRLVSGGSVNSKVIVEVNEQKLTDREGDIFSIVMDSKNRHAIGNYATYCHVGVLDGSQGNNNEEYLAAKGAERMLQEFNINPFSIVSAVMNAPGENILGYKIRADANRTTTLASSVAEIYGGGGKAQEAAASMKLGILEYACSSEDFRELIRKETHERAISFFETDESKKPKKNLFEKPKPLNELVGTEGLDSARDYLNVVGKVSYLRSRGKGRYLTLALNVYDEVEQKNLLFDQDDISYLIRLNNVVVDTWCAKDMKNIEANVIYAVVNEPVKPYLIGLYCSKEPAEDNGARDELLEKHASNIAGLFGDNPLEQVQILQEISGSKYSLTLVKAPLPDLQYTSRDIALTSCINIEMKERLVRILGERDDK